MLIDLAIKLDANKIPYQIMHFNGNTTFQSLQKTLQEKSLLASTFVDAKDKKLLQKTFFVSTFWLMHSDAITRVA